MDSEATVDIGMAMMSLTILAIIRYFPLFPFHHAKISKSEELS